MGGVDEPTRLERLMTLRSTQEAALESEIPVRDFASLSREYRATLADIAELQPKAQEGDAVDEIAQRRAARRSGAAKSSARAKRSG